MNISTSSYDTTLMQQMQQTQRKEPPSATDITSEVMELNDIDGDGLLSIEELGISAESFSSMDSDGDGNLSEEELTSSFSSMLEGMKGGETSPEDFANLLSSMGLEVPPPPGKGGHGGPPDASKMASDIFSQNDTDGDGLLTLSELGIDEDLFSSMDADGDGSITQKELAQGLTALFESVESGEMSKDEAGEVLSQLGVEKPQGGAGGGGGGSSEEEYEDADANQDGTVSAAEYAAYYGSDSENYTMQLISTLLEAMNKEESESGETENSTDLKKFKELMAMANTQTQDSQTQNELGQFLSNLSTNSQTSRQAYA